MPYTGGLRRSVQPYTNAGVWGTGYNPVHEYYGSPPTRLEDWPMRHDDVSPPSQAVPEVIVNPEMWGYTLEDSRVTGVDYDNRPSWNEQPELYRGDADDHPPWTAPQAASENFRAQKMGAHRYRQKLVDALPFETVSEGWRNKPKGQPADSKPSDPSQYEMQTSMRQRYRTRDNVNALARDTDQPRTGIFSRVIGQRLKIYSGELRHYDMFPRQQTPIPRPFSYRTAGTADPRYLQPNEYLMKYPIQRTPPPDPPIGERESDIQAGYGYTPEDVGYGYGI